MTPIAKDDPGKVQQIESDEPLTILIEDDVSVREAIEALLDSVGLPVRAYASVQDYLEAPRSPRPQVLVLDIRLPGCSGLELQDMLSGDADAPPIIFVSAHADIPMSVRAMKAGAIEFLSKPFRDQDLIDAIHMGIERDRKRRSADRERSSMRRRYETLTPRERQVMDLVVKGLLNKQIAGELGLSEITVKVHRGQAVRKMRASSLADLVRMAGALGLDEAQP